MRFFGSIQSILVISVSAVLSVAVAGCGADRAPGGQGDTLVSESAVPPSQDNSKPQVSNLDKSWADYKFNYDSSFRDVIIPEFPILAIVEDQAIRYPDWTDRWPDDGEIETIHQFQVVLVEPLKGDLPPSFNFYSFGDDVPSKKKDGPYIVALCRMGDKFYADAMFGRFDDDIPELEGFVRQRLADTEYEDFGPEACSFNLDLPD